MEDLEFKYIVGGGGGHSIQIKNFAWSWSPPSPPSSPSWPPAPPATPPSPSSPSSPPSPPSLPSPPLTMSSAITCSAGSFPGEVGWSLSCSDGTTLNGGAPYTSSSPLAVALGATCTVDAFGNGWQGAEWAAPGFGQSFSLASGQGTKSFVVQFQPTAPPSPPSLASAELLYADQGCGAQASNLGTSFDTVHECLAAALQTDGCGDSVMWSPYSSSWGC
eukprot:scaffold100014_cov56-Phaeocystis_antarctica.AAC.1